MARLGGKVAVITGGASGIGLALVERFIGEGAQVVFCDLSAERGRAYNGQLGGAPVHYAGRGEREDGESIAQRLGTGARFVVADVSVPDEVQRVVRTAVAEFGGVDVLVNNAGVGPEEGPLEDVPAAVLERIFSVNFKGAWLFIQNAVPFMRQRGGGSIVNLASVLGLRAWPEHNAYSASKGALLALSRSAAVELAPSLIRVNTVCPGLHLTPLWYDPPRGLRVDPQRLARHFAAAQPLPRAGTAEDVANAVVWLASDDASFVTGQSIVVDGGLEAQLFSGMTLAAFWRGVIKLAQDTPGNESE